MFYGLRGSGANINLCHAKAGTGKKPSGSLPAEAQRAFRRESDGDRNDRKRTAFAKLIICLRVADALDLDLGDVLKSVPKNKRNK
jgi:hypothetical protein